MSDLISITGVRALGIHGVLAAERTYRQPFIVDISAEVETGRAARTDEVGHTVSYGDMAADAVAVITGESVNLIETLADRIATKVIARGALSATVIVHKPEAPVGTEFSDASVQITRRSPVTDSDAGIRHVVLGLGANLGNTRGALRWAANAISELDVYVNAVSDFFTTVPVWLPVRLRSPITSPPRSRWIRRFLPTISRPSSSASRFVAGACATSAGVPGSSISISWISMASRGATSA